MKLMVILFCTILLLTNTYSGSYDAIVLIASKGGFPYSLLRESYIEPRKTKVEEEYKNKSTERSLSTKSLNVIEEIFVEPAVGNEKSLHSQGLSPEDRLVSPVEQIIKLFEAYSPSTESDSPPDDEGSFYSLQKSPYQSSRCFSTSSLEVCPHSTEPTPDEGDKEFSLKRVETQVTFSELDEDSSFENEFFCCREAFNRVETPKSEDGQEDFYTAVAASPAMVTVTFTRTNATVQVPFCRDRPKDSREVSTLVAQRSAPPPLTPINAVQRPLGPNSEQ